MRKDFPGSYEEKKNGFIMKVPFSELGNPESFKWAVIVISSSRGVTVAKDYCPGKDEGLASFP